MSNLSDVKRRLTTVKQTRQITGAMQTVSVAKMRKADEVCQNTAAYLSLITDIMRNVASACNTGDDFGFVAPKDGKDVLIVLSSERGLCGGFDNAIFAVAEKITDENTLVMPVGRTAVNRYKKANNADFRFGELGLSHFALAKSISEYLLTQYGNGVKSISVAYSVVNKQAVCPVTERILPVEGCAENNGGAEIVFEPSPQRVLSALVPLYLSGKLYGAIKNNYAAEQFARHQAMTSATESADELIVTLTSEYNRERQTAVTGQIVEIVGATSALSRKGVGGEKRY